MKNTLITASLFLITITAFSQNTIVVYGKVLDSANKQPLVNASVFCMNTTQGTVSNNDGYFYLKLPAGGYDMVVSYTGYEKNVVRISNNHLASDTLTIELKKAEKTMEEVAIVASNEVKDGWEKYGTFFLENFIGTTGNAANCKLENPEALHFFFNKKKNRLKVTAKENDLIIKNYALGYTIRYQLDSFTYEYNNSVSQFTGYPLFQEIDTTPSIKIQWVKNRARTYLGSRLHFMRAYYNNMLADEGFYVEKMAEDPRSAKGEYINNFYDSSFYLVDSGSAIVDWVGRYRISYKSVLPDKKFLTEYKLPENMRMQVTVIELPDGFIIEQNGYFYNQNEMTNTGYWAWKKLAELLPYDYYYQ